MIGPENTALENIPGRDPICRRARRNNKALSLLETVIALFVLLGVLTFTLTLYSQSMGYLTKVERNAIAANFADNVLSEVRQWAKEPANFNSDEWTPFLSYVDPDFPGFEARVTSAFADAWSPCSAQEVDRPPDRQVVMGATIKVADVEVLWEGRPFFTVTTLLSQPKQAVDPANPVVVEPVGAPPALLAPDASQEYTARLVGPGGEEIEDVKFFWSVQPLSGNATISEQARDGSTGTLTNVYILPPAGVRLYLGGNCQVIATASYFGTEYRGLSAPIELGRP